MFKRWLLALRKETLLALISVFSLGSTILTFFPFLASSRFRLVSIICFVVAFAWANFKVFEGQSKESDGLKLASLKTDTRKAELVMRPHGQSWYILVRQNLSAAEPCDRSYLELDCDIENKGNRTSNIDQFEILIDGVEHPYSGLKPTYPTIYGRHATHPQQGAGLGHVGHFTIDSEQMQRAKLGFFVSYLPPGYDARNRQQVLAPINCTFKITDTEGVTASCRLELKEEK